MTASKMDDIEKIITGNRDVHKAIELPEAIIGFALASPDSNLYLEEGKDYYTPTYSHYLISGEGWSEKEAMEEFWKDYDSQGPYGGSEIFWRLKPVLECERLFQKECDHYFIVARFSINDSITSR